MELPATQPTKSPLEVTIYPMGTYPGDKKTETENTSWLSFEDILDTINPLQHIPILSDAYQAVTGDEQSGGAKIAGGALFGGALGFVTSLFDTILESETGESLTGHIADLFEQADDPSDDQPLQNQQFVSASRYQAQNAYVSVQRWLG